ncbi:MAG: hypothetical protein NC037_01040 [Bacteroides sp.]|nr:hypothetical protein [Bacillota bacterium]MCM1393508.1 hypothetical protein [[Eubacterium] siraeum]MCM1455101.1 hypothetical protein [Bacteroides sp.]
MKAKSKRQTKSRIALKIIVAVLCVVILAALGLSIAFNVLQYQKWQELTASASDDDQGKSDDNPTMLIFDFPDNDGNKIMPLIASDPVVAVPAPPVQTLTVVFSPENADAKINWSMRFADPNPDEKDANDYLFLEPFSYGSSQASIVLIKQFWGQIIVEASVRNYPDIKATCTVSCSSLLWRENLTSLPYTVSVDTSEDGYHYVADFVVGVGHAEDYIYEDFVYVFFGQQTFEGYDYEYYFESNGVETELYIELTDEYFAVGGAQGVYMYVDNLSEDYWTIRSILQPNI